MLTGVVDREGQQRQVASALDGAHYARLLLARSARAARCLDFTRRGDELGQNVDALVINLFWLEFGYGLSAVAAKFSDGYCSLPTHPAGCLVVGDN